MSRKTVLSDTRLYVLVFTVLLMTVFQIGNSNFLSAKNIFELLKSNSYMVIMSMAMLVVIISGGIDISICPIAASAEYLMAWMISKNSEIKPIIVFVAPILLALCLGSLNGFLVQKLKVPPMIVTISTMNIYYGVLQLLSAGNSIYVFPEWFKKLGAANIFSFIDKNGFSSGLSLLTVFCAATVLITFLMLSKTKIGRQICAIGGNQQAASRVGISLKKLHLVVYGFSGLLCGIAGVVHGLSAQYVMPSVLFGQEMLIIAAIALGGANLLGGFGTVSGTIMGVVIIRCITSGLTLLRVSSYWQDAILGFVILASIVIGAAKSVMCRRKKQ